ncbi:major facilitator superfamily domain-containing protein [Fusarium oxysporum Fo47]|nr:major facilitator superfamily domain-containing protein [Fusarium oxysporum Fo47]QKD59400.2 major facilitator superfamily domain-containing protein [Fusarium oxysporum Fo47]
MNRYMLMQIPSNMILTRVRPSIYIPAWVCLWSAVSAATAVCNSFTHLIIIRFFLGICEAPFFPGVFFLLSCWYTKKELALRYAFLYSGLVLATAVSGLLAAGIFAGLGGVAGLQGWRWLFILEGAATFLLGLVAFVMLPDFPATKSQDWLFTAEEKEVAVTRMVRDAVSEEEHDQSVLHGLKLAVTDIKVWAFALLLLSNQSAYGFNYFYPAIVRGFNLGSRTITLVCTAPPYLLGAFISYFIAWHSDRKAERGWHISGAILFAIVGFIISAATINIPARYVASWAASSVGQTPTKKACATAIINVTGQLGTIWSPYFFDSNDEPSIITMMRRVNRDGMMWMKHAIVPHVVATKVSVTMKCKSSRKGRFITRLYPHFIPFLYLSVSDMGVKEDSKDLSRVQSREKEGETAIVSEKYADVTLRLVEEHGDQFGPLTPEKEKKLRRKLYWHVMGLLSAINLLLFIDKSTLGYAAILGLFEETGINKAQYNNLGTFFYVGYLAAQWPGHYLMQRLPFGKFVAGLVFMWGATILLHCVATKYAGLVVLRIALGAAESVVVPAMEMTIGMFFNRHEQSFLQPFLWVTSALAPVCAAFISYGLLWSHSAVLPWKLFMIVTGGLSVVLSVFVWFFYPNNPAEARFLTLEEKVHSIKRVHESSQSSIEQKQFKKTQFQETLRDPVSWLFALQAFTLMMSNNLTYGQQNLITTALGVDALGSTLVAAAGGGFGVAICLAGTFALKWWPSNLALHGLVWCIPAVAGGIGMVAINWNEKLGMLACLLLAGHTYGNTYIIALGWATSSAAGYTKKLTRNVMFMIGYSVANLISPQIWVPKDAPRYYGAWISMILISWVGTPAILFVIQFILKKRNKERKEWAAGLSEEERLAHEFGEVEQLDENGQVVRRKVEIALLDLTDLENKFYIYPI